MKNSNPISAMSAASSTAVEYSVSSPPRARRNVAANNAMAGKFLAEAIEELEDLNEYAAECGLPPPSPKAKETARDILKKIVPAVPRGYALSPWEEGAVAVYSGDGKGRRVSIYCDAEGRASYYVIRPDGPSDRGGARPARELPLNLIVGALRELDSRPE